MMNEQELQSQIVALTRAFGWHRPMQTPCGQLIPIAEAHALIELAQNAPLPQHELVVRLNLAKSTVSRLVEKLVKRGWVEKRRSSADGRVWELVLTEVGEVKSAELATARQAKLAAVWQHIPQSEQPAVVQALSTLVEAIRESDR